MAKDDNAAFWDIRSQIFDGKVIKVYEDAYTQTIERTKKYLKNTDRALDIGCGTGVTTIPLSSCVGHMTAIDTSSGMMEQAVDKAEQNHITNIEFYRGDIFTEELKPGEFDVVMAFNVLLYMPDQVAAMQRIYELLKPGGYFIAASDCLKHSFTREAIKKWVKSRTGQMPHVEFYTPESLDRQVERYGFTILERKNLFEHPINYFFAAQKKENG